MNLISPSQKTWCFQRLTAAINRVSVMRWKMVYAFILGVFILSGCHHSHSGKKAENNLPAKAVISIPKTLHPVQGTLEYTSYIGTPDHPTIDGGIINSTDEVPVNHDMPSTKQLFHQQQATLVKVSEAHQSSFNDDWATSEKVKQLLVEAASQGKLSYVLKKTNQMQLPASVAIVPMVESNYQTGAVSPKGAAGAWQLMPSTAKDYGINNQERFHQRILHLDCWIIYISNLAIGN